MTAILAWLRGTLAIPASWIGPDLVATTATTDDGPYVTADRLTEVGARKVATLLRVPVVEAALPTVEEEAVLYLLLNNGGSGHSAADIRAAEEVARPGSSQ